MRGPQNSNGGLTLIPLPGFEGLAEQVKTHIVAEGKKKREDAWRRGEENPYTPVDIAVPKFDLRVNGEPYIQLGKQHIGGHDCVIIASGPGTYKRLVKMWMTLGYVVGRHARRVALVTGYLPLARSDKDEGEEEFALSSLMTHLTLSAAYGKLDRMIAVDLHAPQAVMAAPPGVITEVSLARRLVDKMLEDCKSVERRIVFLLPDDGAMKRYELAIELAGRSRDLGFPLVWGDKRRHNSTTSDLQRLHGTVEALHGALVLSLDDEIASGGTNIGAANAVKRQYGAAEYWSGTVHGVLCGNALQKLSDPACSIDRIYVSDTIPFDHRPEFQPLIRSGRLQVISWVEDLAHIIYYHHWDRSIRERR
ncbi:MAG: hypothetical protein UX10_C0005G0018 [Candidatus Magasanikbacteria bacterium GW2011_GWA2_45_39]|uniref:ribose-phosphate diphosphokinase n=1 Tax=Candidatus Magasanikbacteria bacterium GW2011_GWA2_45_39 TaxID=1619041 RepID=A0A0G1MIA3_9BACT|nr:MAG: hypothetical protein UX10_C0005G0018 [Candidatus Magasanikbacteria bacterium GW2011_GWA2_45_39]